jgi:hypothetical protein
MKYLLGEGRRNHGEDQPRCDHQQDREVRVTQWIGWNGCGGWKGEGALEVTIAEIEESFMEIEIQHNEVAIEGIENEIVMKGKTGMILEFSLDGIAWKRLRSQYVRLRLHDHLQQGERVGTKENRAEINEFDFSGNSKTLKGRICRDKAEKWNSLGN